MSDIVALLKLDVFWLSLYWCIFSFLLWFYYKKHFSKYNSFDISVLGVFFSLFLHRIVHIFAFPSIYSVYYWSLNPVAWIQGSRVFLGSKPWIIFNLTQGSFDFRILIISFFLTFLLIIFFQKTNILRIYNYIYKILFLLFPFVLIESFIKNFWIGSVTSKSWGINYLNYSDMRHPVQIYEFLLWLFIFGFITFLSKRFSGLKRSLGYIAAFLLLSGESVILNFFAYNIPSFVINWFLILSIITFAILLFNLVTSKLRKSKISKDQKTFTNIGNDIKRFS
jgi:hypothetical protein